MKRGKISVEERLEMKIDFKKDGITPENIAKKFDRSLTTVIKILRIKCSYVPAKQVAAMPAKKASKPAKVGMLKRGKISAAEQAEIVEAAKTSTPEAIAAKFCRNLDTINKIIGSKKPVKSAPSLAALKTAIEMNDDEVLQAVTKAEEPSLKAGAVSDDEQAEIQEAYNTQKIAPEDIATKFNRSLETILKVLHIKHYVPVTPPAEDPVGFKHQKEYVKFLEEAVQSLLLERGMNNDISIPHFKNPSASFKRANILAQIEAAQ